MDISIIVFGWFVCSVLTYIHITSTTMNRWGDILGVDKKDIRIALFLAVFGPLGLVSAVLANYVVDIPILQKPHIILWPRKPGERK